MVSVSLSSAVASRLVDRSFFLTQLERRGTHLAAGPQAYLLAMFRVKSVMRKLDDPTTPALESCQIMVNDGVYLDANATLEVAMPLFERSNFVYVPVVNLAEDGPPELIGTLFQVDALKAYNRALADTAAEEHSWTGCLDVFDGDQFVRIKGQMVFDPRDVFIWVFIGPNAIRNCLAFGHN